MVNQVALIGTVSKLTVTGGAAVTGGVVGGVVIGAGIVIAANSAD